MKKSKRFLAFAMSAILTTTMFSSMAFANSEGGTIGGDSTLTQAVINVVVPTSLSFALDPLQLSYSEDAVDAGETNQIADHAFTLVNKSNAPILAAFGLYVDINETADEAVELVAAYDDDGTAIDPVDPLKNTAEDKQMYFATRVATGFATAPAPQTIDLTTDVATVRGAFEDATKTPDKSYIDIADPTGLSETTPDMSMAFLLGKATYTADAPTALASAEAGVAIFQFYAQMNSYAPWKAGDIKVTGAYTLSALSAATYTEHTVDNSIMDDDALGKTLVKADDVDDVVAFDDTDGPFGVKPVIVTAPQWTFAGATAAADNSANTNKITLSKGANASGFALPINLAGKTVTSLGVITSASATINYASPADYTVTGNVVTLTGTRVGMLPAADLTLFVVADGVTYKAKLTVTN